MPSSLLQSTSHTIYIMDPNGFDKRPTMSNNKATSSESNDSFDEEDVDMASNPNGHRQHDYINVKDENAGQSDKPLSNKVSCFCPKTV